jgi:dihydrofolate reductase
MANIVYIATSLDGYIAKVDGDLSWLDEVPNPEKSDFGFADFMNSIDALVMGRNTYEKVLSFGIDWPYEKKVFVLSSKLNKVDERVKGKVEIVSGELEEIVKELNAKGFKNLYIDGGKTIQSFLKKDLIDELNITRVPIILGEGIPLFSKQTNEIKLKHLETISHANGLVQSIYKKAQ